MAHAMARTCDTDEKWLLQRTFYMMNWRQGKNQQDDPNYASRIYICKRDLQALGINTDSWEVIATDRDAWRQIVKVELSQYEETQRVKAEERRLHKKTVCVASRLALTCSKSGRDCHSQIGLYSHKRCCTMGANLWSFGNDRCQKKFAGQYPL